MSKVTHSLVGPLGGPGSLLRAAPADMGRLKGGQGLIWGSQGGLWGTLGESLEGPWEGFGGHWVATGSSEGVWEPILRYLEKPSILLVKLYI